MPKIEKLMWFRVTEPIRPTHKTLTLFAYERPVSAAIRIIGYGYWDETTKRWRHANGEEVQDSTVFAPDEENVVEYWAVPTGNMR